MTTPTPNTPGWTEGREEDSFDLWIDTLEIDVIQFEFGYEPGEFTVYPAHWRPLYDEGLTPRAAWQRALDGFSAERAEREREQAENWARIQREDAEAISRRGALNAANPARGK